MSEETRYVIRLSTGQYYHGRDGNGEPKWTRVPSWAYVLTDPIELGEILEWLENSEHDYSLLAPK